MTRAEHLAWAKERALGELERGSTSNAVASMISDLGKHPDLKDNAVLANRSAMMALFGDERDVRFWIERFD